MPIGTTIVLGLFTGLTIYLGLPIARLRGVPRSVKTFLSMLATGVLLFLLYDMIGKASEPISEALDQLRTQGTVSHALQPLLADLALLVTGLGLGLVGLVYFNRYFQARYKRARTTAASSDVPAGMMVAADANTGGTTAATVGTMATELGPRALALMIASGIGLHNFSEGLAIGQSAASGALQLAAVLIIGFGLHNMTEGFGIAGPLTDQAVSWKFIALLGIIGGGPTFLGTVLGTVFSSPQLFIFCLALAAGAIIYVISELLGAARRFKAQEIVMWGLFAGFLLGYGTDLIVSFAGA